MATVALTTANALEVLIPDPEASTKPLAADLSAGTFVREDTSGNWIQATGASTTTNKGARLLLTTGKTGQAATAARTGVYAGFTISQAFNVDLFISDTGTLADAAGTVSTVMARVEALTANAVTAAHDKGIRLNCPL